MKKVVIIFGLPGSGKGTQANLIADKLELTHFDTGKFIERTVHNPANKNNKIIQREKKLFDTGMLCTPGWALKTVRDRVITFSHAGLGMVFSGSPRTMFEAFGDLKNRGLMETFEREYGRKNIKILFLKIGLKTSVKRNVGRRICPTCNAVVISYVHKNPLCPICLSKLKRRTLDEPKIIKEVRFKEYMNRTAPILTELKKRNYKIYEINGEQLPAKVFNSAFRYLK